MNYQVLARKWRPHNFTEVVGQSHVITPLVNALKHQRLHQAYLFTGTRGVGKTTLARILAKAINCVNLQEFNPCGQCHICVSVDQGNFLDLIEVDAASRTKVEDTRDLLDNVQYAPNQGRYKVYLIDEVHMLSGHSFNALLKTLEEPPPHVKFLLATTDPQKIPVTVLSRCLQFNLKRLLPNEIFTQMDHILKQEKIEFQAEALNLLAGAADGSMRDGLSLLDQAIVYSNGCVDENSVRSMLGAIANQPIQAILKALAHADAQAIFAEIENISQLTPDFSALLQQILQYLHRVALVQHVPAYVHHDLDIAFISQLAQSISPEDVQLYYQIGLIGQKDLALAPDPRSGFEMVMLRMLAFRPIGSEPIQSQSESKQIPGNVPSSESFKSESLTVAPSLKSNAFNNWESIVANLKAMNKQFASCCVLEHLDDNQCFLALDPQYETLLDQEAVDKLQKALRDLLNKPIKLIVEVKTLATSTPAQQITQAQEKRQDAAIEEIYQDANVRYLQQKFDAQILTETIQPI
jgi:DNA polymerase-3 subunit gamma/tau